MYSWLKKWDHQSNVSSIDWLTRAILWLQAKYGNEGLLPYEWWQSSVNLYEMEERFHEYFPQLRQYADDISCGFHEYENFSVAIFTCITGENQFIEFCGFVVEDETVLIEMLLCME